MIYLDHSATSFPKPETVYQKMDDFYRNSGVNPGRAGYRASVQASQAVEKVRDLLAGFFHIRNSKNLIFTFNATDALNMALFGVLKPGDEVITTVMEHNSVLRPLYRLEKEKGIQVTHIRPDGEFVSPDLIAKYLTKKTRLVVINHASNVTGWIQPVEEIGRYIRAHSGALFMVDAAQTAGILPVDVEVMNIDLLVFAGHKALYGPVGTGGLYVSDSADLDYFRVGGSGIHSETEKHPSDMPYKLEAGTLNSFGIIGLGEGINFIRRTGMDRLLKKERELKELLLDELKDMNHIRLFTSERQENGLSIISFNMEGLSPAETAAILDSEDIAVRDGLHCAPLMHKHLGTFPDGTVRISIGYFNTEEDIKILSDVLQKIDKQLD